MLGCRVLRKLTLVVTPVASATAAPVEPTLSRSWKESRMLKKPVMLHGENAEAWLGVAAHHTRAGARGEWRTAAPCHPGRGGHADTPDLSNLPLRNKTGRHQTDLL